MTALVTLVMWPFSQFSSGRCINTRNTVKKHGTKCPRENANESMSLNDCSSIACASAWVCYLNGVYTVASTTKDKSNSEQIRHNNNVVEYKKKLNSSFSQVFFVFGLFVRIKLHSQNHNYLDTHTISLRRNMETIQFNGSRLVRVVGFRSISSICYFVHSLNGSALFGMGDTFFSQQRCPSPLAVHRITLHLVRLH